MQLYRLDQETKIWSDGGSLRPEAGLHFSQASLSRCIKGSRQENINLGREKPAIGFVPCPVLELNVYTELQAGLSTSLRSRQSQSSSCFCPGPHSR